jgi:ABC-type multidrug transport system fused ATPase/permease subunit
MNITNKYKLILIVGSIYLLMYINYYLAILLVVIFFQITILISIFQRLKSVFKFNKDKCVKGIALELKEVTGALEKYYKYEYIVEFEWKKIKYITTYKFLSFIKPDYENKILDVWVDELTPENSIVTASAGYENRWFLLFDSLAILSILFVIDYFLLQKIFH